MPIFDQGYQHWSGELGGRVRRWFAIARCGVRAGSKIRILRLVLLMAGAPALTLAGILSIWGMFERKSAMSDTVRPILELFLGQASAVLDNPRAYRVEIWTLAYHYFLMYEMWFCMVLIMLVGPNLISQDLRFNALPLYFSRPLRRIDYFIGKLGVIFWFVSLVIIVPSIVAYVLGLAFSLDITILRDTFGVMARSVLYGVIITVSAGLLILALSSLTRSSRYVALAWVGIWLLSLVVSSIMSSIQQDERRFAHYRQQSVANRARDRNGVQEFDYAAFRKAEDEYQKGELEATRKDWRPVISYLDNYTRIGNQLLNTQASWERLGELLPDEMQARFLNDHEGPQYPWTWSAGVLAGLFFLSVLILNFRVKSLDRLR